MNNICQDFMLKTVLPREKVQIAISVYDPTGTYAKHAGATIVSVFANTSSSVCIHILHDNTLTKENIEKLEKIARDYQQEIEFHIVDLPARILSYDCRHLTQGTLFRLLVPDILSEEKIIYLDCDIIVDLDINILWEISVEGYPLAAARDGLLLCCGDERSKRIVKNNDMQLEKYFNAGVLILNLRYIRENHSLAQEAFQFLETHENEWADQDALNSLFQENYVRLDKKFNAFPILTDEYEKGKIWHWAGTKPWVGFTSMIDIIYWEYLSLTPWGSSELHLILQFQDELKRSNNSDKKIIVFGAGSGGEKMCRRLPIAVEYIVDNSQTKWGQYLNGIPICSPNYLFDEDKNKVLIIIASIYHAEISMQLQDMGFEKYVNFL